jgi:TolB-like protein
VAIFPFEERGAGVKGYGDKVADILFASLVADPDLYLVDRADIAKLIQEQEVNLSGAVTPGQATQVGQLTGAKILVAGSIVEADNTLYVVAKMIGTETSRVLGESVKGKTDDQIGPLVEALAKKVADTIKAKSTELIAADVKPEDRVKKITDALGDKARPKVVINVTERHVGQATIDPAAETELAMLCEQTGFKVLDSTTVAGDADVLIQGEGFSEFALRRGNLISVKARLEVKAVDRATGNVIATDRQTAVVVDLSEQIAGKAALQEAAAIIAERMLPKLAK